VGWKNIDLDRPQESIMTGQEYRAALVDRIVSGVPGLQEDYLKAPQITPPKQGPLSVIMPAGEEAGAGEIFETPAAEDAESP
jgi:hypothetical protein